MTEKMPSSVRFGARPRIDRMSSHSAAERPCSAITVGVRGAGESMGAVFVPVGGCRRQRSVGRLSKIERWTPCPAETGFTAETPRGRARQEPRCDAGGKGLRENGAMDPMPSGEGGEASAQGAGEAGLLTAGAQEGADPGGAGAVLPAGAAGAGEARGRARAGAEAAMEAAAAVGHGGLAAVAAAGGAGAA